MGNLRADEGKLSLAHTRPTPSPRFPTSDVPRPPKTKEIEMPYAVHNHYLLQEGTLCEHS